MKRILLVDPEIELRTHSILSCNNVAEALAILKKDFLKEPNLVFVLDNTFLTPPDLVLCNLYNVGQVVGLVNYCKKNSIKMKFIADRVTKINTKWSIELGIEIISKIEAFKLLGLK